MGSQGLVKPFAATQGGNSRNRRFVGDFAGGGTMSKSLSRSSDGKLVYQLKPTVKYRPNKLDSSDYPGHVVYRRSTTHDGGPRAARGEAAPALAPGLLKGHISSPDVFNPFDEGRIEVWAGAGLIKVIK